MENNNVSSDWVGVITAPTTEIQAIQQNISALQNEWLKQRSEGINTLCGQHLDKTETHALVTYPVEEIRTDTGVHYSELVALLPLSLLDSGEATPRSKVKDFPHLLLDRFVADTPTLRAH